MKGIKKLVALAVGMLMTSSILTGCSTEGMALYSAFMKSQDIKTMEVQTDVTLNISAANMSAKEQQVMQQVMPVINGAKISALTKVNQNKDKTSSKVQSNITMNVGQMPLDMGLWVDSDISGDKPVIREVIKLPELLKMSMPKEYANKEYMVLDFGQMMDVPGAPQIDYKKIAEFSKEFQPKFTDFFKKYAEQFNPGIGIIKKVGRQYVAQPKLLQSADIYEIRLNDKTFKQLVRYTVNNFAENKDAMTFLKDYILASLSIVGLPKDELTASTAELEKGFADFQTNLPQIIATINAFMDKIDSENVKILGDKGIVMTYAVNDEGYIINEKGNLELVIDLPGLMKLSGLKAPEGVEAQLPTGVYTVNIEFSNDIRKINGYVHMDAPEVNETNSLSLTDLMMTVPGAQPVPELSK